MSPRTIRVWSAVHKWTSLLCTAFLLVTCLTGLPLIFHEEIADWLQDDPPYAVLPADTPMAPLDAMVAQARAHYPDQIVTSLFIDDDEPKVIVFMAPSWTTFTRDPDSRHWLKFDARTGALIRDSAAQPPAAAFILLLFHLHADLLAGLPGALFMAAMGGLFLAALVSGVVLYAPFMRRLRFGTVRRSRSPRLRWLDIHNLLGVVALAWMMVVGFTGVINELSQPLFAVWQATDVKAMLQRWEGTAPPRAAELGSVDGAYRTAKAARPGMLVTSLIYPGSPFGTPFHYVLWAKGNTPLTSRLFSPALVDARTGRLDAVLDMPWYLRALELSRPLHFGDYGGMPLKILWGLLDLATIVVLGSGLYLWLRPARMRAGSPADEIDAPAPAVGN